MSKETNHAILLRRIRELLDQLPPDVLEQLIREWELELGLVEALGLAKEYGYGEPPDPTKDESDKDDQESLPDE